jgi:hypothetical protein
MANIVRAKEPTNLAQVNLNAFNPRDANKYFNNFFEIPVEVSSNVDAAIIAYFEQISDNKESARALASAVIYTSVKQGLNPMETLKEFQQLPQGELDAYTAMFLNFERKGTSYLGISNQPEINKYVQRSIRA